MEERKDLHGNVGRPLSSLRPGGNLKSSLSGKSTPKAGTPRGSPAFRRLSSRTPRRDGRTSGQWIRSNSVLLWLLLITLWAYLGFYVQSKWAHGDNNNQELIGYSSNTKSSTNVSDADEHHQSDAVTNGDFLVLKNGSSGNQTGQSKDSLNLKNINVSLAKSSRSASSRRSRSLKNKKGKQRGKIRAKQKIAADGQKDNLEEQEPDIPKTNTTYRLLVGPFASLEDTILEWSAEKRSGTCDRHGEFAKLVWSRKFVLIFHELSMTGAPLSMLELATELMSCGASVSAVVLSKKGGLMQEINRRRIKVLEDKEKISFKAAMKADLIIAGSAVCSSWIEQYLQHNIAGSGQIAWWIMENRREYFNRSKPVLNRVKMLIFLSESQSIQWLAWCKEEGIQLHTPPEIIPLSVNDELAFVAGIPCTLNTPSYSVEKMLEKRQLLRDAVRKEMGLTDNDMLVMSLSSINPGKGQLLLLESTLLMVGRGLADKDSIKEETDSDTIVGQVRSSTTGKKKARALFQNVGRIGKSGKKLYHSDKSSGTSNEPKKKNSVLPNYISTNNHTDRMTRSNTFNLSKVLTDNEETQDHVLKVLIGSVGSKSNKVFYVKGLLQFLSQHPELSKVVLWTPATTHVASLYSAADVYVINSQGLGETFGRVTIEAMAYGLPVLGTDAGGTKEIVEHNVTGLLHPLGRPGSQVLSQNLLYLLKNPTERKQMGMRGRRKVEKIYLKGHMYKKFFLVLFKCMRIK
ncbi:Udp-glycosyltransferase superfamily protein [Thalictrum thalictroides]|uniref:Udp-glycosyltransferase superfamily protein n=1 Tax=Thalictrum thalictroides TaxID=46969 RepID=A0A7J6X4C0_THATH|nr:Udp-glycosyltransferase superfamily protein [Thalictrum thalictroides]